ncbi:hypothetical protein NM208_g17200 [Fusarium decemcellulare]|uniref:Uncharacterized protein n=1 Tax=Fusarium decemcellulare TaxID=57161 RepID=A0ACC1R817_9HYPO|nr:hypothetical protein NM208_g17200 [Fusarium decemcellulare]
MQKLQLLSLADGLADLLQQAEKELPRCCLQAPPIENRRFSECVFPDPELGPLWTSAIGGQSTVGGPLLDERCLSLSELDLFLGFFFFLAAAARLPLLFWRPAVASTSFPTYTWLYTLELVATNDNLSPSMPPKSRFTRLDAFTKTVDEARIRTTSGGIVTIVSLLVVIFLAWGEWAEYRRIEIHPELIVDKGRAIWKHWVADLA